MFTHLTDDPGQILGLAKKKLTETVFDPLVA
jgi:hypothetical protein